MPAILVDADACPAVIKDIIYRAAERLKIETLLVANMLLRTPPSQFIRALQVPRGFDVADNEIVKRVEAGDLVITADIPLAADVILVGDLGEPIDCEIVFDETSQGTALRSQPLQDGFLAERMLRV